MQLDYRGGLTQLNRCRCHEFEDDHLQWVEKVKDSKKIGKETRNNLSDFIKEVAIDYSISFVDNTIIDEMNIRNATLQAMQTAISDLDITPEYVYIDGNYYVSKDNIPYQCVEQGDNKIFAIACASILAKVARDDYVTNVMAMTYDRYNWENNKCYGTKDHYLAIEKYGITPLHRRSFNLHLA